MKKIFRMALVLALAGSALLYTSFTKDYAPDILEVQKKVDQVNSDLQTALNTLEGVKSDISGLRSTDADLQKQIDDANTAIDDAIKTLNKAIADGDTEVKGIFFQYGSKNRIIFQSIRCVIRKICSQNLTNDLQKVICILVFTG